MQVLRHLSLLTRWYSGNQFPPVVDRLYRELADLAGTRVALQFRASGTCLALLAVLDRLKCDTILLSDELRQVEAEALVKPFHVTALMRGLVLPDTVEPWPHFQGTADRQWAGRSQ